MAAALMCVFGVIYVTLLYVKKSILDESEYNYFCTGLLDQKYATYVKIP